MHYRWSILCGDLAPPQTLQPDQGRARSCQTNDDSWRQETKGKGGILDQTELKKGSAEANGYLRGLSLPYTDSSCPGKPRNQFRKLQLDFLALMILALDTATPPPATRDNVSREIRGTGQRSSYSVSSSQRSWCLYVCGFVAQRPSGVQPAFALINDTHTDLLAGTGTQLGRLETKAQTPRYSAT